MVKKIDFFLGANSGGGFFSLYDQLGRPEDTYDLIVLKGGPGVGKSTMMKAIGAAAEKRGLDVEYIRCSGDPDSLDAVQIPQLKTAAVDGTAPHVIEPRYPAAVDRYVNLGQCYDVDRLKERRREIVACSEGYQAEYRKAYACLHACRAVRAEVEESLRPWMNGEKLRRRLNNLWLRLRPGRKKTAGRERRRFLGGLTPAGRCWCEESIHTLCPGVCALQDTYHMAAPALEELCSRILRDGYDVVACPDPDVPARLSHLLVPEVGAAFVTVDGNTTLRRAPDRRILVDQMLDREHIRTVRGSLRLKDRLARALETEGAEHLCLAGEKHGELELIYRPFVDFAAAEEMTRAECRRIFGTL